MRLLRPDQYDAMTKTKNTPVYTPPDAGAHANDGSVQGTTPGFKDSRIFKCFLAPHPTPCRIIALRVVMERIRGTAMTTTEVIHERPGFASRTRQDWRTWPVLWVMPRHVALEYRRVQSIGFAVVGWREVVLTG